MAETFKLISSIPDAVESVSVFGRNYIRDRGGSWYNDVGGGKYLPLPAGTIPYALQATNNQFLPPDDLVIDGLTATSQKGAFIHNDTRNLPPAGSQGPQVTVSETIKPQMSPADPNFSVNSPLKNNSSTMYEWKTVNGTQYNVADPAGRAAYNAVAGSNYSPPTPPAQTAPSAARSSGMTLPITFRDKTYDLATSSGMAAYKAALGITESTPMAPQSQTDRLINTYNQNKGTLSPAQISQAMAPTNVEEIKYIESINLPRLQATPTDTSAANATATAFDAANKSEYQTLNDFTKQMADLQNQQALQNQNWLQQVWSSQTPTSEIRAQREAELGINTKEFLAEERIALEKLNSKKKELELLNVAMDEEKMRAEDRLATTGHISREQAAIERRYNPQIRRLSAEVNSDAALIEMRRGNFNNAQSLINQAVSDATADQRDKRDMLFAFFQENQRQFEAMSEIYKTYYLKSMEIEQRNYEQSLKDRQYASEAIMKYNSLGAGISVYDSPSAVAQKVASVGGELAYYSQQQKTQFQYSKSGQNDGITGQDDFAEDLSAMADQKNFPDRVSLENWLSRNKTALVTKYGNDRYNQMLSEVGRLFPITPAANQDKKSGNFLSNLFSFKSSTPTQIPTSNSKQQISNLFAGYQPLTLDSSTSSSFFTNLFGK